MSRDKLIELAERCEKATGDDALELINLECDICAALGMETGTHETPFTASIDAAIKLVPIGLFPLLDWSGPHCRLRVYHAGECRDVSGATGLAITPALALCAAALRARSQSTPDILRSDD